MTLYKVCVTYGGCGVVLYYVMFTDKLPFYLDKDEKVMQCLHAGFKFPEKGWVNVSSDTTR